MYEKNHHFLLPFNSLKNEELEYPSNSTETQYTNTNTKAHLITIPN